MRIYSMTATFGKLERETLTLEPGMNILQAPNEWGKSTWCAFLTAMFYGLETRAKSTKTALADKERFAPWSGSPMEGRIDLNWQGRDITIERKTKRRVPLGDFRAYETQTGVDIPELNGANCGSMLLGVERSVFLRAGLIRFSDLPVTQDEALRRRLNALVTTGDEDATGDKLAGALRDLKNRCRYHKSGLLPQTEAERDELQRTLRELETEQGQTTACQTRLSQIEARLLELENHRHALLYQAAQADAGHVAQAEESWREAADRLRVAEEQCRELPDREQVDRMLHRLRRLEQARMDLQMEAHMAHQEPQCVEAPLPFRGMDGEAAIAQAQTDTKALESHTRGNRWLSLLSLLILAAGIALVFWQPILGGILSAVGAAGLIAALCVAAKNRRICRRIAAKYGEIPKENWLALAQTYDQACRSHRQSLSRFQALQAEWEERRAALQAEIQTATGGRPLETARGEWEASASAWEELAAAQRDCCRWEQHLKTLRTMAKTAQKPAFPDALTYTEAETARLLSDAQSERQRLQNRLGQAQGRMEALGRPEELRQKLDQTNSRIRQLEQTYEALILAQETLAEAATRLQRRFAPRIASRAQSLMTAFTEGRYNRLTLAEDLSLRAGTDQEATLRETLWRSDGTTDQLYLSLRLAVAEALTPDVPLVLDDALVRFDDRRLKAALAVLEELGHTKQILLFTCQSREKALR